MYVCTKCRKAFKRSPARINKFNMPDYFYTDDCWERVTYITKLCRKCKDKDFPIRLTEFESLPYDTSAPTVRLMVTPTIR